MQRCGFVVGCQGLIDDFRFGLEDPLDFLDVFLFNVPEEILVPGVAVGYAFVDASNAHFFLE